jgi:NADH:ubiquinone oxidoreductase subunit 2 (subunit N)
VVFGAAASAVGVYGMSLIYGATGSLDLATIAQRAHEGLSGGGGGATELLTLDYYLSWE